MAGHLVLFDSSVDPCLLEADGHTVSRVAQLDPTQPMDVALIPSGHPQAAYISAELRSKRPEVAQVSLITEVHEVPTPGIDDVMHWPLRTQERRQLLWMADAVRHTRNARALADQTPLAEIGKMVTQVMHEIRSPMTALSAKLQWLKHKSKDNAELSQMSAKLDDEVTRLAKLSTDIIELGRTSRKDRTSGVWQTLQEVLALYRETCEQSGIELEVRGPQDTSRVPFAAEELHQVFQNLLVNAIDATPPEEKIVIDVKAEGEALAVEFRNPGHLTDDTMAHAFDLFYTTKRNGSGLGLPIVKRIVGDVVAQNDGAHVVFKVKLPLVQNARTI